MSPDLSAVAYLIAGVLFILALRGLSSPETARRGNALGIIGMVIAVATTLANPGVIGDDHADDAQRVRPWSRRLGESEWKPALLILSSSKSRFSC